VDTARETGLAAVK